MAEIMTKYSDANEYRGGDFEYRVYMALGAFAYMAMAVEADSQGNNNTTHIWRDWFGEINSAKAVLRDDESSVLGTRYAEKLIELIKAAPVPEVQQSYVIELQI